MSYNEQSFMNVAERQSITFMNVAERQSKSDLNSDRLYRPVLKGKKKMESVIEQAIVNVELPQ